MSSTILDKISGLFRPEAPHWACEFTSRHVIVAGVDGKRSRVSGRSAVQLPEGALAGSLVDLNMTNAEVLRPILKDALTRAGFQGSECGVVIPDDSARIAFLSADNLPKDVREQLTFIRWKLKKTVPFDVDTAQIAYKIVGPHTGNETGGKAGVDILVALSPRSVIQQYEHLLESLDIHAGYITPSTLGALNLFQPPAQDALFVKTAPDCVTTSIFQNRKLKFYRKVNEASLYEALYPTILYYQDKLGGSGIGHLTVCGYDSTASPADITGGDRPPLQIPQETQRLQPVSFEDLYKPVLGALNMAWQSLN